MSVAATVEGTTVTLRGARLDAENNTMDLTNLRLSPSQVIAIAAIVATLAGTWFVTLWRVNDVATSVKVLTEAIQQQREVNSRQDQELRDVRKEAMHP